MGESLGVAGTSLSLRLGQWFMSNRMHREKPRENKAKMICIETEIEKDKETVLLSHEVQTGPPGFINSQRSLGVAQSNLSLRFG